MTFLPKGLWGEHGAWAIVLTSCGAGLIAGRPPSVAALLLVVATALFTAAKGLAVRARRTGRGYGVMAFFGVAGFACAVPLALRSPIPMGAAAVLLGPFVFAYFWKADSPAFTRSLWIEGLGAILGSLAGPLVFLASQSHPSPASGVPEVREASLLWMALSSLYVPGVLRARLGKDSASVLRWSALASVAIGVGICAVLGTLGLIAPWGVLYGLAFGEDLLHISRIPNWTTRRLGVTLTLKYTLAALCLSLAWNTLPS